ncbi:MAG: hypothetical protein ACOVP1_05390 [Bacteroidia bacterium]
MKKQVLFVTILLGTMVACKKESTTNPTTNPTETAVEKAKKVLMAGDWVMDANFIGIGSGPMIPIPKEDCEKDDYAKFTSDKQIVFNGTEKCDPEEMSSDTTTYEFNSKADSITLITKEERITFGFSNPSTGVIELNISTPEFKQKTILKRK